MRQKHQTDNYIRERNLEGEGIYKYNLSIFATNS